MKAKRLMLTLICGLGVLSNGASLVAQEKTPNREVHVQEGTVFITSQGQEGQGAARIMVTPRANGDTVVFAATEMSFDGKVVKGAPYSAQAITESIQTLGDGNRIVRKSTAQVYRDGEGRTRREQTISAVGPYTSAGDTPQVIFINDPVSGVNYIFDAVKKTARKIEVMPMKRHRDMVKAESEAATTKMMQRRKAEDDEAMVRDRIFDVPMPPPGAGIAFGPSRERIKYREPKVESLGKQTIEGVEAEGKRLTMTIAAGEIGNEQPINIIDETWYSPELQTVVMSRHSDPRFGETNYRLTGINRSEPARSLFELPSDYTVEEVVPGNMRFKLERELQRAREKKENQL